jgi:uncharacterized protein
LGATRLFFATDLHGSERCFRKFTHAGRVYGASLLILGGDLAGKGIAPIVRDGSGWRCEFAGARLRLATEEEAAAVADRMRQAGLYPHRCTADEYQALAESEPMRAALFHRLMQETLRRWLELAEERLSGTGVRCLAILGNDDEPALAACFEGLRSVTYAEESLVVLEGGYSVFSLGFSNPTPWRTPRELPEEELERRIRDGLRHLPGTDRLILNLHCPPYGSNLDLAPALDEELRVRREMGETKLAPVGSTAVRDAIVRHQPLLSLHGHVHESRGAVRIGRTLAINPGSDYGEGVLRGAIVNLQENRVVSYQLVAA